MRQFLISTTEYEANVGRLLKRRLVKLKSEAAAALIERNFAAIETNLDGAETQGCGEENTKCRSANIKVKGENELEALATALAELMHFDLRHFELADMTARLSYSLEGKQRILKNALKSTEELPCPDSIVSKLCEYLKSYSALNLEGYLRFRMRNDIELWSAAVDAAFAEELESSLYNELFSVLGILPVIDSIGNERVCVILRPDGSCSISNAPISASEEGERSGRQFRIECAPGNSDGVLSLLSGMAPRCVSVIDLSLGRCDELKRAIEELFSPCE